MQRSITLTESCFVPSPVAWLFCRLRNRRFFRGQAPTPIENHATFSLFPVFRNCIASKDRLFFEGFGGVTPDSQLVWGQATISFILLISGVILQIAIAGSIVTYFLSSSRFSERLAVRSFIAADAGFRDAEVHIARDVNFVQSGTKTYSMTVGNDTAEVAVSRETDAVNNVYVYTITSTGTALSRQKKLVGTILVHQVTGLIEFKSLTEQSVN